MPENSDRHYEIVFSPDSQRSLKKLTIQIQQRIITAIFALAENPRPSGVKALKGLPNLLRIRVGKYRIVYQIQDKQL
ncbi:MAG: type II toxin-antitoxin system RelE/ParE family toxin, partial [Cyanobacteria bacterium P01_E01_bin.42]